MAHGHAGPGAGALYYPRSVTASIANQPDKEPERTIMGRKSHFTGLQSQLRVPAKAAVAGVPPVYRAVCRMAQGLLAVPMHPFDSFATCRDSR